MHENKLYLVFESKKLDIDIRTYFPSSPQSQSPKIILFSLILTDFFFFVPNFCKSGDVFDFWRTFIFIGLFINFLVLYEKIKMI